MLCSFAPLRLPFSLYPQVDAIKVVGLADSGFFTPGEQVEGDCDFAGRMSFLYNELNGSAAASPLCVASAGPDEGHRCLLAENAIRFSRTPIFTAQSISDGWQLEWIACNATASSEAGIRHRQRVLESLEAAVGGPIAGGGSTVGKRHGAFIDGCQHHCHCYQDLRVGGVSQAEAFSRFYAAAWTPQGAEGDQEVVWKAETCQMELNKGYSPDCPYKPFAWEH